MARLLMLPVVRNGKMGISCLITGSSMLRIYEFASRSKRTFTQWQDQFIVSVCCSVASTCPVRQLDSHLLPPWPSRRAPRASSCTFTVLLDPTSSQLIYRRLSVKKIKRSPELNTAHQALNLRHRLLRLSSRLFSLSVSCHRTSCSLFHSSRTRECWRRHEVCGAKT